MIDNDSINPFETVSEFVATSYNHVTSRVKYFIDHSLDDVAEDVVTIAGMVAYFQYSSHLMPGNKIPAVFSPVAYWGVKLVADWIGEQAEKVVKENYDPNENNQNVTNPLISVVDDITEDVSKAVCLGYKVTTAIGVGEVIRYGRNQLSNSNLPDGKAAYDKIDSAIKWFDIAIGSYEFMDSYSECNDLANSHGHWAANQAESIGEQLCNSIPEEVKVLGQFLTLSENE